MLNKMLINGELVSGEGAAIDVFNPSTGDKICDIQEASAAQVSAAVDAAEAAFDSWSQTAPAERSALLLQLADKIEAMGEDFAELESLDVGKPYSAALEVQTTHMFKHICLTGMYVCSKKPRT